MQVQAKARGVRISPRKVRLVVNLVRGMSAKTALDQLRFMKKGAATPVYKLIHSAVANAVHNFGIDPNTLVIKSITADDGPTLHRFMPRAMGRATPLRKRSTHIAVILDGADSETKPKAKEVAVEAVSESKKTTKTAKKADQPKKKPVQRQKKASETKKTS